MKRTYTPLLWLLFGAGGMVSAFLYPVHLFLIGVAHPMDLVAVPSYPTLLELVRSPMTRLYIFTLISLPLFTFAHRFRYMLFDAFRVKHLSGLLALLCYGSALGGTLAAARLLWAAP